MGVEFYCNAEGKEREEDIKGHAGSWAQYEGLTCNLMEVVWSYGGRVFDEEGNVVYNSPETVAAVKTMTDTVVMPELHFSPVN